MLPDCQIAELCTQSCLSVSVLNCCLVLLHPQMSLRMCKGVCVCECVCGFIMGLESFTYISDLHTGNKSISKYYKKAWKVRFSSFSSYIFFKSNLIESHLCGCMEETDRPAGDEFKLCLLAFHLVLLMDAKTFFFLV